MGRDRYCLFVFLHIYKSNVGPRNVFVLFKNGMKMGLFLENRKLIFCGVDLGREQLFRGENGPGFVGPGWQNGAHFLDENGK